MSSGAAGAGVDTYSHDYLIVCLARTLLRWPAAARREFLANWRDNHGKASLERLTAALDHEGNAGG